MARARKGTKVAVTVDERTEEMSLAALQCRRLSHAWSEIPQGAARRAELLALGQTEERMRCLRCTWVKWEIIDLSSGEVVGRGAEKYPDNYLVKDRGYGRLPRAEARKALIARRGLT